MSVSNAAVNRFWEIDSLRGLAIIMMIVSNLATDIAYFGIFNIDVYSGFWILFARTVVSAFIFLVGISLTLSYSRIKNKPGREIHIKYLKRGLKIFGWGLIITLVTWIFLQEDFIIFGVLHLIGVSIILSHFLLEKKYLNVFIGISIILTGIYLQTFSFDFQYLVWLGFRPSGFFSVDYVPVFPWLGVVMLGIFSGNLLYPEGKSRFQIKDLSNYIFIKSLSFLGRNSLLIYLIHQPILIFTLWLLFPFPKGFPL